MRVKHLWAVSIAVLGYPPPPPARYNPYKVNPYAEYDIGFTRATTPAAFSHILTPGLTCAF